MCVIWGEISQSAQFLVGAGDFSRAGFSGEKNSFAPSKFYLIRETEAKKSKIFCKTSSLQW